MAEQQTNMGSSSTPQAVVKKNKGISPIWILPLLAVLIGAWLIYKGIADAPIDVVITFESGEGITAGKTKVVYKGIEAGTVQDITIHPDLESVDAHVEFSQRAKPLLVSTSQFWLVKPRVTLRGIAGLGTILSGDFIAVRPGKKEGSQTKRFTALTEPPPLADDLEGLHLKLISDTLDSFAQGSPVYYKHLEVGEVVKSRPLIETGQTETKIFIQPEFESLVNTHSRFYNASGIEIEGSLKGFTLRTQSLTSVLVGGIAFATPTHMKPGSQSEDNDTFTLYESYEQSQKRGVAITITFPSAEGVNPETNILYNGLKVGEVDSVSFGKTVNSIVVRAHLLSHATEFAVEHSLFWIVKPEVSLAGVSNLNTILSGNYITVRPGHRTNKPQHTFTGSQPPSVQTPLAEGLAIVLSADQRGSIKIGNEVFYREIAVGRVTGFSLAKTADKVLINAVIDKRYAPLVRKNSVFWNASGISVHAGLFSGVQVNTESLKAILEGGVAFATPDNDDMGAPAGPNDVFPLRHELNEDWLAWKPVIQLSDK